jgi:hypothetical protein
MKADRTDFQINFAGVDQEPATWIARQLNQHGYTTALAVGDPGAPGSRNLAEALGEAHFVVVVLSPNYLSSTWAESAWEEVKDSEDRLIPVRIRSFQSASHLAEGRYIDIVGLDPNEAGRKLVDEIQDRLQQYRKRQFSALAPDFSISTADIPEPKLASDQWTTVDRLGFQVYVDAITQFVLHPQTCAPFTIGINGRWGSGKTSLMRMIQEQFDPVNADGKRGTIRLTDHSRSRLAEYPRNHWWSKAFSRLRWLPNNHPRGDEPPPTEHVTVGETVERAEESAEQKQRRLQELKAEPPTVKSGQFQQGDRWRPTIWFNPWVCETEEQVWAGLANAIISQITDRMTIIERERFWLALNLSRIDASAIRNRITRILIGRSLPLCFILIALLVLSLGALIAGATLPAGLIASSGALIVTAGSALSRRRLLQTDASTSFQSLLREPDYPWAYPLEPMVESTKAITPTLRPDPDYRARLGFFHLVQEDIKRVLELVSTEARPVIVFIDDLDRCSPSVVTQVIEAISLFVAGTFPNSIFVIAMEPAVVASHIEAMHDSAAESAHRNKVWEPASLGWMFLEKIVQLPLSMPVHQEQGRIKSYVDSLLADPGADIHRGDDSHLVLTPTNLGIVDKIADEIRRANPRPDEIRQQAQRIQQSLLPSADGDTIDPLTALAVRQVFAELLNDNRKEVRDAIWAGVRWMETSNPRQIKRFVNIFRFYAFVTAEHGLRNKRSLELLQTAKLAALATRWPHLLEILGKSMSDGQIWLTWLETNTSDDLPELVRTLGHGGDREVSKFFQAGQPEILDQLQTFLLKDNVIIGAGARHLI